MILDLHRQGMSISAIARQNGMDRKTVSRLIKRGLEPPCYGPRLPRKTCLSDYESFLRERLAQYPELNATKLLREIKAIGFEGSYSSVRDFVRSSRPPILQQYERRFETPAGKQAQVDFAYFRTVFDDEPDVERVVWLFSIVLGHSRFMWGRFVAHQDLQSVLRCHIEAFEAMGGVPCEILYDRMKTAVLGEVDDKGIVYNGKLLALASHYGFLPKACKPYRAKTKGKVERPFRYVREDFFLGEKFRNLDDLNARLQYWLGTVANARYHATTQRIVSEHFAEEKPKLLRLPAGTFTAVLQFERRITKDGMVSVAGNLYSVPDSTRRRTVDVHSTARNIQIIENGQVVAVHEVIEGRGQRRVLHGHRAASARAIPEEIPLPPETDGASVSTRSLAFYGAVGQRLAEVGVQ